MKLRVLESLRMTKAVNRSAHVGQTTAVSRRSLLQRGLSGQQGQALAEAVVVLSIATVLLTAMATGSRLQMQWHNDLVDAHLTALSVARGHYEGVARGAVPSGRSGWLEKGWNIARRIGDVLMSRRKPRSGHAEGAAAGLRKAATAAFQSAGAQVLADGFGAGNELISSYPPQQSRGRQLDSGIKAFGRHLIQKYDRSNGERLVTDDVFSRVTLYDAQADSRWPENPHLAEILGGSLQWVRVRTGSSFGNHAWQIRGHGAISDTHQNVDRIDRSHALWQQAANRSRQIVRRLAPMTEQVDAPWFRPAPQTDWLSKWSDVSGADKQTRWGALGAHFKHWVGEFF